MRDKEKPQNNVSKADVILSKRVFYLKGSTLDSKKFSRGISFSFIPYLSRVTGNKCNESKQIGLKPSVIEMQTW